MAKAGSAGRKRRAAASGSEAALAAAMGRLPVALALFDADRRLAACNQRLAALGLFPKRLLKRGAALRELLRFDPELKRNGRGRRELMLPDGRTLGVSTSRIAPGHLLVTYEDATAARVAEQRYDLAMRSINEGVYDWDIAKGTIYYSDRVVAATGMTARAIRTPGDWRKRIHPEDLPEYDRRLVEHFKGGSERFECDYRFRALDGSWRWARQHGIAVRDAGGRALRMVGSTGDISELKRVEQALKESQERYALATRAATEGIYEWNLEAGSLYLSERAKEFYGVASDALTPAGWNARVHSEDLQGYRDAITAYFKGDLPQFEHEYRVRNAAGGYSWILDRAVAVRDDAGKVVRLVGAVSDISQRKHNELELRRAHDEATEALERQTASADVLAAMSGAMTDAKPVFERIVRNVRRLFNTRFAVLQLLRGDMVEMAALDGDAGFERLRERYPRPLDDTTVGGRAMLTKQPFQICPVRDNPATPRATVQFARDFGFDSLVFSPMIHEGRVIGAIGAARPEARPFDERQVALIKTFADQAVIAIENVRLFNETKEALERQTATADILRVISSTPGDTQPVFDAIVGSAQRLMAAKSAVLLLRRESEFAVGGYAGPNIVELPEQVRVAPLDAEKNFPSRAILHGEVVHVTDWEADDVPEHERVVGRAFGIGSGLMVPLLQDGEGLGALAVTRESKGPFDEREIALLQSFAAQAVIAIENVRLFNETKEALERQKASAEVLRVISASVEDTRPVFEAIVAACARLFEGHQIGINLVDEQGRVHLRACEGPNREALHRYFAEQVETQRGTDLNLKRGVAHFPDVEAAGVPVAVRDGCRLWGAKSIVYAPMVAAGRGIGAIWVSRDRVGPFSDKEIALLTSFADQAVIAIQNAGLFKELQQRTEALSKSVQQLTALGEVGQAIGSTLDLETVLKTIVSRAVQLAGLDAGVIYEYDEASGQFELRATENLDEESVAEFRQAAVRRGEGAVGTCVEMREPVQVPDTHDSAYPARLRGLLDRSSGLRALLAVPLLREEHIVGALLVARASPGDFPAETVDLLKTFASQSGLAIQNARLFREIAEKGRQLEVASRHKSQFLASMSHELRTPLNAILGFNEMILGEVYGAVPEDMKEPLADMQSSGRHLLRLINNVLDLAKIEAGRMELALSDYPAHDIVENVRATLRPLAESKGLELGTSVPADLPLAFGDAGRLTQCLMNLAGNSLKFTKQGRVDIAVELNGDGLLRYRVTDTGIGIPPDKIGSLFAEFKQTDATIASEYGGTGLGLSITKKFIEMHGGRIWVESEPGRGSTFIFEIPLRAAT